MRDPKAIEAEFNSLFKEGERSPAALMMVANITATVRDHQKRYSADPTFEGLQLCLAWEKVLDATLERQGVKVGDR